MDATLEHVRHTLGCAAAGAAAPGVTEVLSLVRAWGGAGQATVLVHGDRLPSPSAALANAAMAHSLEMDNNDDRIAYKTSVAVIPAALATAELVAREQGRAVSGADFITAATLGIDLGIRLGLAANPEPSHAHAPTLGPLAAAAAAARLMGLDAPRMLDALGIAYCRCSHSAAGTVSPSLTKRLGAGLAAQAGVFAAQLAATGFPSGTDVLQGSSGLYRKFYGREGDPDRLLRELGRSYQQVGVGPKPYPSCRYTHPAIDAALAMLSRGLDPGEIRGVEVTVGRRDQQVVVGTTPELERKKRRPEGVVDAQFGLPFTLALTLLRGRPLPRHFTAEALRDEEVLDLAGRIRVRVDPALDGWPASVKPQILEVRTAAGRTLRERVDHPRGSARNPVPASDLKELFLHLVGGAPEPRLAARAEALAEMLAGLEEIEDMGRVIGRLAPPF